MAFRRQIAREPKPPAADDNERSLRAANGLKTGMFQRELAGDDQFTESARYVAVTWGSLDREQSHVLFNILLIYS